MTKISYFFPRSVDSNPLLNLYLICSQISTELEAISIPLLELKMCNNVCVREYFHQHPSMKDRVGSVEVNFRSRSYPESQLRDRLLGIVPIWGSRVDIVDMMRWDAPTSEGQRVEGKAIFRR